MRTFCTIITSNYFPYAVALYKSINSFNKGESLLVLTVDDADKLPDTTKYPGISFISSKDICFEKNAVSIFTKYVGNDSDALRWALKPILISYLLKKGYSKVIYTDCDIFFFNNYNFLFDELDKYGIILTPGHTTRNPAEHENEFLSRFQYGQFNAGFIGSSIKSLPALNWWAECCAYKIDTNFEKGLFVDQKYLDAMPVLFDFVGIVRHYGCNIAFWNQHECKRVSSNNQTLINGTFPIIFIHFTNKYIPELMNGNDHKILPYFLQYKKVFEESGTLMKVFINDIPNYKEPHVFLKIKRKLLIRTRIKRFLFRLSQKM